MLQAEVEQLGADTVKQTVAGVRLQTDTRTLYRICLWSRLANRVLVEIGRFQFDSQQTLYEGIRSLDWSEHLDVDTTFAVHCSGRGGGIDNTHYGALRVKDAIVDQFQDRDGRRPSVDTRQPGVGIRVHLSRGEAVVSIDLSGSSLHRRGYRTEGGRAPLKENLASALLMRAGWPAIADAGGALLDPVCGSATLIVEGCQMAMGIAPGLTRRHWGFDAWLGHVPAAWHQLHTEAQQQRQQAEYERWPEVVGYDANTGALDNARRNIERAGLSARIKVYRKRIEDLVRPTHKEFAPGLVIANPPYGIRLDDDGDPDSLYAALGDTLKAQFDGWQAAVITADAELGFQLGLRARKVHRFYNGALPSQLLLFDVEAGSHRQRHPLSAQLANDTPPSSGAQMFANRLKKNLKRLKKWVAAGNIECFRIYDADMPEYAVAIDRYADWIHVAEYLAPAGVSRDAAERRLGEVMQVLPAVLDTPPERIVLKQRRRQRGEHQYERHSGGGARIEVREHNARLLVNMTDYLDTGLFLDHRRLRRELAELSPGKRLLNLFCYTGTATVQAALAGATASTSVDLSATYLDWARRNFELNGLDLAEHELVRADCTEWLATTRQRYDLVLLDPPTFSNSKRMENSFDVQRDHAGLIDAAMRVLSADGIVVFLHPPQEVFDYTAVSTANTRCVMSVVTGWTRTSGARDNSIKCG